MNDKVPKSAKRPKVPGSGGSRKGKPNKITADLRAMIQGALADAGGRKYLVTQAKENPSAFLTLLGKTLPKEISGLDGSPIRHAVHVVWGNE